jgi:hypothetical protein
VSFVNAVPMASILNKDTPKKHYKKTSISAEISRCRLCNSVGDPRHCKKLFGKSNRIVLNNAEIIYGGVLPQQDGLPHLICRSCERRLNNAIQLRSTIEETQQSLQKDMRSKRCLEVSPSVTKPPVKVHSACSRRRSLDFFTPDPVLKPVSTFLYSFRSFHPNLLHILM